MSEQLEYLQEYANILRDIVEEYITESARMTLSETTRIEIKELFEYERRMRVSCLDKFNAPGYLAAVEYFQSQGDKDKSKACGSVVVNVLEDDIKKYLQGVGVDNVDEDGDEVIEKCAEFCERLASDFQSRSGLSTVVSPPFGNRNSIPQGVGFSYDQYEKMDISFFVDKKKVIVVELTMKAL